MKILITGGAGFIGSHITEALLKEGHKICVIDNYQTGRRDNLSAHDNLTIVEGTIADSELVNQVFTDFQPEKVLHAAASYKDPQNWTEDVDTNVLGTINIVKASKRVGVKRIVYFQTSLCYGLHPIEQPITLNHPLYGGTSFGGSSYAISKTTGELYIELSGLDFVSFRLANVYGPRNLSGPVPTFFRRLTNNESCVVVDTRRDFIFVYDMIEVVIKALKGCGKGYYHLSTGKDYSIKELFDLVGKTLNIPFQNVEIKPRRPDDAPTILLDPSKAKKDFNWEAKTPIEVGIKIAIDWYKTHALTETFTHLKDVHK